MSDVNCPFCNAEGWARENENAVLENKKGNLETLWGIQFLEHYGDCPFNGIPCYRANYHSKEDAISAYSIKKCQCISK